MTWPKASVFGGRLVHGRDQKIALRVLLAGDIALNPQVCPRGSGGQDDPRGRRPQPVHTVRETAWDNPLIASTANGQLYYTESIGGVLASLGSGSSAVYPG